MERRSARDRGRQLKEVPRATDGDSHHHGDECEVDDAALGRETVRQGQDAANRGGEDNKGADQLQQLQQQPMPGKDKRLLDKIPRKVCASAATISFSVID